MRYRCSAHLWNFLRYSGCGQVTFQNEQAAEATSVSHSQLHHVHFALNPQGGFTSTPRKYPEEQARLNAAIYPPGYEMKMAVQEFHKLHGPKSE